jgi:hypothetical protein
VGIAPSSVQAISNLARNLIDNAEALAVAGAYRAYLGLLDGDRCAVIGHFIAVIFASFAINGGNWLRFVIPESFENESKIGIFTRCDCTL